MEKYGVAPRPGSEEAIALGCTCISGPHIKDDGTIDEERGQHVVYHMACPIHGFKPEWFDK